MVSRSGQLRRREGENISLTTPHSSRHLTLTPVPVAPFVGQELWDSPVSLFGSAVWCHCASLFEFFFFFLSASSSICFIIEDVALTASTWY